MTSCAPLRPAFRFPYRRQTWRVARGRPHARRPADTAASTPAAIRIRRVTATTARVHNSDLSNRCRDEWTALSRALARSQSVRTAGSGAHWTRL